MPGQRKSVEIVNFDEKNQELSQWGIGVVVNAEGYIFFNLEKNFLY